MQQEPRSLLDRIRPTLYTFVAGMLVGMVVGWFFHGLVGTLLWVAFIILLLIPLVALLLLWQSLKSGPSRRTPPTFTDIEATWREVDMDPSRRDRSA